LSFLDVFVLHADAVKAQGSASAGLDLALACPSWPSARCWPPAGCTAAVAPPGPGAAPRPLVIVPYTFLELRPEGTKRQLKVVQGWITGHARQLIATAVIIVGTYNDSHRPDPA